MTKVPSWMRNSMRNEYQRFILKKTIETANKDVKYGIKIFI